MIEDEMLKFERVIVYWRRFGPFLEAAICAVVRAVLTAVIKRGGPLRAADVSQVRCSHLLPLTPSFLNVMWCDSYKMKMTCSKPSLDAGLNTFHLTAKSLWSVNEAFVIYRVLDAAH